MSTKLQQVIARSRLSTLDGDLREAGEQMLRDKFFPKNNSTEIDRDILEALQRKNLLDEIYLAIHSPVNRKFKKLFYISRPDLIAIAKTIRRAKEELGLFSLSSMCLVMGWDFYQELLRADNCYIRHGERDISMLGCRVVVNDSGFVSYLEVEF
jgi:hypothetical protein